MKKTNLFKLLALLVVLLTCIPQTRAVELGNGQYIYINYSTSTWGAASAKFKFNWYWNVGDYCCVDNEAGRVSGENYAYAQTQNEYTRAVQILRFNSSYSEQWNYTTTVAVSDATKNCITLTAAVSNNYSFSWTTYAPPMSTVTLSDNGTSIVSGSGTSGDPYLVYVSSKIKVAASGTKAVADPAATIYYDFKQSSTSKQNSTTTTYQFDASSTANTTYTINLDGYTKVSSTSGTKKAATALYYKTIAIPATPSLTMSGASPSTLKSGETVTINVERLNSSATISYQYSTDGSSWNALTPASTSNSGQTATWVIPAITATTTYYFRAQMTDGETKTTLSASVTAYGKKTIHVKNSNNWANFYIHHWGENDASGTDWPGETAGISSYGGQWKNVVIYSCYDGFILNANSSGESNQTVDLTYGGYSDGGCYAIGTNSGKRTLSTTAVTCPSAPTSVTTTAAPSPLTNTSATLKGNIGGNGNDNITDYGFYWGTTSACGTKAQVGTSNKTGAISKAVTVTAGNTYYFKTYATNAFGTTYGTVQSFVAPHKVTISSAVGCSAISPTAGTQYMKVGDNISATAATGYTFSSWSTSNVTLGTPSTSEGVTTSAISSFSADNATIAPVYAAKSYTVTLDVDEENKGTIAGAATSHIVYYNTVVSDISDLPTGATGYGLDGYYTSAGGAGTKLFNGDGSCIASVTGYTDADKKWIRDGGVALYAYYKKAEITALTLSESIVSPSTSITVTPTIAPTPTGSPIVCYEIQYSNGTALSPQPTMSKVGNVLTLTAPAASATYRIEAKLYLTSCGGTLLHTTYTTFQVAGEHTVTVRYQDSEGRTIKESGTLEGIKPLEWSDNFSAPSITGYTFQKWVQGDGVTIDGADGNGEKTTNPIRIKANYDGTLTAVYNKKRMIYFYNTLNWGSVYVYFYKNDSYWESSGSSRGSGSKTTSTWTDTPYSEGLHGQMLPVSEGSKIYYFDAEGAGVNASYDDVVFTKDSQHNYEFFYNTEAVRRGDYKSSIPMFVPLSDQTPETHNGTAYTNNGYWMNYPENTGYTLKIYNAWNATKETAAVRSIAFPYSADIKMPLKLDVEFNEANHEYWFMVYRNDGTYLGNTWNFKQGYNDEQVISGGDNKSKITTSAPGNYKLTLTYHDNGSGTVNYYIDVDYPIATGDYRIYYSDNATWSLGAHTKDTWNHPSHSIAKATTEAKNDTISFFVSKGEGISHTMKFQKASVTNEGVVTWSDVAGGSITIPSSVTESGVYNFIVSQPAGGASISLEKVEPYTGNFYIRTDCAGNTKWDSFKNLDHQMTYSDYAAENSGYTHYYAHWVESGNNVKFTIANDYSMCVSDTLTQDYGTTIANISAAGALNSGNASIRFMYNQSTNKISRAYISGSSVISDRFLVLEGDAKMFDENGDALSISGLNANEINLVDDQNFVYERTIKVQTGAEAKLTAKYNNNVQYFIGGSGSTAADSVELLGGKASATKYSMRIVYDFKTNRLVKAYIPSGADITEDLAINADIMLVREHQEAGQQLTFDGGSLSKVKTVYGVMRFNRWTLNNKSTAEGHAPVGDPKSTSERGLYWISFPFDVNLSDVFGFGSYGTDWIVMYYDGAERASNGFWADTESFWKYITNRQGVVLEAGKGYVLALDLDRMRDNNTEFWANDIQQVELFFPSADEVEDIEATDTEITVPSHECTIDRRTDKETQDINKDRTKADSHWNVIGVPSYANYGSALKDKDGNTITWKDPETQDLPYLYEWNMVDNSYTPHTGTTYPFKTMHAYMVQYTGKIKWELASATPSSVSPRRAQAQNTDFRLELQQNDQMVDQTIVRMTNDEAVSANFAFDEDMMKEFNKGKANIYTMIEGYLPAGGNTMPTSEQTTIVPVGVKIATNDDYTFSIPDGTSGVGVTLIDNFTGTRTNISAVDYTVSLEAGTYNERFVLEISPIEQVITNLEPSAMDQQSDVRKVLIDGLLYIVRDGKVYDARGAKVE